MNGGLSSGLNVNSLPILSRTVLLCNKLSYLSNDNAGDHRLYDSEGEP